MARNSKLKKSVSDDGHVYLNSRFRDAVMHTHFSCTDRLVRVCRRLSNYLGVQCLCLDLRSISAIAMDHYGYVVRLRTAVCRRLLGAWMLIAVLPCVYVCL